MKIVLATNNKNKAAEIKALFENMSIELHLFDEFANVDIEETGLSFIENALLKARFVAELTGLPALADDSGLVVPALDGEPGIYSARYAGVGQNHQAHLDKLLATINAKGISRPFAKMHCTLVFMRTAKDPIPLIAEGEWLGEIIDTPKGDKGFGYDPIFFLPHENKTAAELTLAEKNQQSHRFQAISKMKQLLADQLCMPCQ